MMRQAAESELGMKTMELGGGVYLHHATTDRFKTEIFSVRMLFPVTAGRSAADTLIPRLLLRSCRDYPSERALQIRLDELYGSDLSHAVERIGDMRVTAFTLDFLSERYAPMGALLREQAISLLLSVILDPVYENGLTFRAADVEREKSAHLDALGAIRNNKGAYALSRCAALMRDPTRYDLPAAGTEEETLSVTQQMLTEQYRRMLTSCEVHFSYVGAADPCEVAQLVTERWSCGRAELHPLVFRRPRAARIRREQEIAEGTQSVLVLGYRTGVYIGDEDAALYPLFTEILSDSPMAKLFINVREKKSLCYSIHAGASLSNGTLKISAGIDGGRAEEAERAIRREISMCRRAMISEQELLCAKESILSAYSAIGDSPADIDAYHCRAKLLRSDSSIKARLRQILSARTEDIARIASRLSPDTVYLLRAGEGGEDA